MTFCIKNYHQPKGLSTKIHDANARFEIKGPMGLGLCPKATGHHFVFAAGTGVLCFVDLVAELCRLNTGQVTLGNSLNSTDKDQEKEINIDPDNFQLHLYVSFPSRNEAVALELFEALEAYCRRTKTNNFHLHLRLSQESMNAQRWDAQFIRQEIGKFGSKNIQKVWVCGPPVMNETFDRVLSGHDQVGAAVSEDTLLEDNISLTPEQYEIL